MTIASFFGKSNFHAVVGVSSQERTEIDNWLRSNKPVEDCGRDELLKVLRARFSDGFEADIKVVNSDSKDCGPYLDAVLFSPTGQEILVLEPGFDRLEQTLVFETDDAQYVVDIRTRNENETPIDDLGELG